MEIKSFTYERSWYGSYYWQRLFSMQKMDDHIARMLEAGWEILLHIPGGRGEFGRSRNAMQLPFYSKEVDLPVAAPKFPDEIIYRCCNYVSDWFEAKKQLALSQKSQTTLTIFVWQGKQTRGCDAHVERAGA